MTTLKKKNFLFIIASIMLCMLAGLFFVGCGENDIYKDVSLSVSSSNIEIFVDEEQELTFTIENYFENMDNSLSFDIVDSSSGTSSSEIASEHVSLKVLSKFGSKITVSVKGVTSGNSTIYARTVEGFKQCEINVTVKQYSKSFEENQDKMMYVTCGNVLYPSSEYFVFDEGTTEKNIRYYYTDNDRAELEGKEFTKIVFNEDKTIAFLNSDGMAVAGSSQTCLYDGQIFRFLAVYTYKEVNELGDEIEVSIKKITKVVALYGIQEENVQLYSLKYDNGSEKLIQEDKNSLSIQLVANKVAQQKQVYYITVPQVQDDIVELCFGYETSDAKTIAFTCKDFTQEANYDSKFNKINNANNKIYELTIFTNSLNTELTDVTLNVYYSFGDETTNFASSDDMDINYKLVIPVEIKLQPESINVTNESKIAITDNLISNTENEIFYNYYVGDYGWVAYYVNVYKTNSTYSGVQVEFNPEYINIRYDGRNFNTTESFVMTDLSKPLYVRGVEGIEEGTTAQIKFSVKSELFDGVAGQLMTKMNYIIKKGASSLNYTNDVFNPEKGEGAYISSSLQNKNVFEDIYADSEYKFFTLETTTPGIVSITNYEPEAPVDGKYHLKFELTPIKTGSATYVIRLDNGVSKTFKVTVVNTFDSLYISLNGGNPDVVKNEYQSPYDDYSQVFSVIINNSNSFSKQLSIDISSDHNDSILDCEEEQFSVEGIIKRISSSINKNTGSIIRNYQTQSQGTVNVTITVVGVGVNNFEKKNNITKKILLKVVSFVPVTDVSVYNYNASSGILEGKADKVVVYSQSTNDASKTAYLRASITPSDTAYYFYDMENKTYTGDKNAKQSLFWTLNDGIYAFDRENASNITDVMLYGKSYYISGRKTFNSTSYIGTFEYDESIDCYKFIASETTTKANFIMYANISQYGLKKSFSVQIECQEYVAVEQIYTTEQINQYSFKNANEKLEFVAYLNPYEATEKGIKVLYVTNQGEIALIDDETDITITKLNSTTSTAWLIQVQMSKATFEKIQDATTEYSGTLYVVPLDWYNQSYKDINGISSAKLSQVLTINIKLQNGTYENPYVLGSVEDVIGIGSTEISRKSHYVVYDMIDMSGFSDYPITKEYDKEINAYVVKEFTGSIRGVGTNAGFENVRITKAEGMFGTIKTNETYGAVEDYYTLENLIFKGSINGKISGNIGMIAGINSSNVMNVKVIIDEDSVVEPNGSANIGLMFGSVSNGGIYQDYSRNYINYDGMILGSALFDSEGKISSSGKYLKIYGKLYEIVNNQIEINGKNYEIFNITKNIVFTDKQIKVTNTTLKSGTINIGSVTGLLTGTIKKTDNSNLKYYNYSAYSVFANILVDVPNTTFRLGGVAGQISGGTINGLLIGGSAKQAIHYSEKTSYVGGIAGYIDTSATSIDNITTRTFVRGYNVGIFVGHSGYSSGTYKNLIAEATDDGKVTGVDASFYVKLTNTMGESLPSSLNYKSLAGAMTGVEVCSYMTSRERIKFNDNETDSGKRDTTFERTVNEYYGDAIVVYIPNGQTNGKIQKNNTDQNVFTQKTDGGLNVTFKSSPCFKVNGESKKATYVYYYEASAVYGENGLTYSNLVSVQDLLDEYFNTLGANDKNYPFVVSGEGVTISSKSSNIAIDSDGNIVIKGTGLAVIELSNLLNQKNVAKIYLYVVNYFNVESYYNYINNIQYEKATGDFDKNTTYYTYDGTNYIKETTPSADDFANYYIETQRTQEIFFIDSLALKNNTEFSVISGEVVNVKITPNTVNKFEKNGKTYQILSSRLINVDGFGIQLADASKFIDYSYSFEQYEKATGTFDASTTYYTKSGSDYIEVETPSAGNFANYYVKVEFGQITEYDGGFFFSKRADSVTTKDSFDLFNLQAQLKFVVGGETYVLDLVNSEDIKASYYEGATAISTDFASYVIVTGDVSSDKVYIVSDTEETLMCELLDEKGNTIYENVCDGIYSGLFSVTANRISGNNFSLNVEVNRNSEEFKNRFTNNIYGIYWLRIYSSSHGYDGISKTIKLIYEEQDVNTISLVSYNNLSTILDGTNVVESEYVVPKQNGVFAVSVSPIDADFDTIRIENDAINSQEGSATASFTVGHIKNGKFVEISGTTTTEGGVEVSKSVLEEKIENFSGTFYVKYLFGSYRVINQAPVKINAKVYKNKKIVTDTSIELKINKKYEIGLKLNGYENKTMVARGLSYQLEISNTGYDTSSLKITIPSKYSTIAYFVDRDGNKTYTIDDITKLADYTLQISNEKINYNGTENVFEIELEATYINELGQEQTEKENLTLTVLEYVINYTLNEDKDIISGMTNGVISSAIGEKTTISIDFNNYSLIEYNAENTEVKSSIDEFISDLNKNGKWTSYIDVNSNGVQIYPNPIVDYSQADKTLFGGNSKFENVYFSNEKLSFWTKRTHSIVEKHYVFTYEGGYVIQNGKYVYSSNQILANKVITEFTFDAFVRGSDEHPNPVYTYDDIKQMSAGAHYILMNDIYVTDENYEPITVSVGSFDGNGYAFIFSNYGRDENRDNQQSVYNFQELNEFGIFTNLQEDAILKNVTVQIGDENSGDVVFLTGSTASLTMGLIASSNSGIITNAEVRNYAGVSFTINGNSSSSSMFGGIVGSNSGYITNSRSTVSVSASFNIAGFVASNSGIIASSYFKNGKLKNNVSATTTSIFTAGFVITNSGTISTSYTCGEREDINYSGIVDWGNLSYDILSNVQASGFAYKNMATGTIKDCYSNLYVSSKSQSAGFVYVNEGKCEKDISFSLVNPNSNTDYGFAGGDSIGTFSDCFYIRSEDYNINKSQNFTTILGVEPLTPKQFVIADDKGNEDVSNAQIFENFSYKETNTNSKIWKYVYSLGRFDLADANLIAFSQKEIEEELTELLDDGTYKYYYKTTSNCSANGAIDNPYVIATVEQFENYLSTSDNTNKHYRIVCDLDFEDASTDIITTYNITFSGNIYGNGMTIKNLNLYSTEVLDNAGLFAEIVGTPTNSVFVKDVTIMPTQVSFSNSICVGTLAGRISYCDISNVNVYGSTISSAETEEDADEKNCVIIGGNIVGGLVGRTEDRYSIDNVEVKISTMAKKITTTESYLLPKIDETIFINTYKKLTSYAGGVVGYLSGTGTARNISVLKSNLTIIGSSAGLGFGFVGRRSVVSNVDIKMHKNTIIRASVFGGILTGGLYGQVSGVNIKGDEDAKYLFSSVPNIPNAVGGIAGVASGATITNINMSQSLEMPTQEGITFTAVSNLGGVVGLLTNSYLGISKISQILITSSLTAHNILGGVVGSVSTSTTLYLSEVAIRKSDNEESPVPTFTISKRISNPNLGGFVGYCDGNLFVTNSYSYANLVINCFTYSTNINAKIGEIVGGFENIYQTTNFTKIKQVENVFVSNKISVNLEDKSTVDSVGDSVQYERHFYNTGINVYNENNNAEISASFVQNSEKHKLLYTKIASTSSTLSEKPGDTNGVITGGISLDNFVNNLKNYASTWKLDYEPDGIELKSNEFLLVFESNFD